MATLIKVNDSKGNPKRGILVVGGMGEIEGKKEVEVLKSCEFIDLDSGKSRVISFGQTNFATFSGTLVVFNNSTVLRLGGLSIKSKDYSVVVEVV